MVMISKCETDIEDFKKWVTRILLPNKKEDTYNIYIKYPDTDTLHKITPQKYFEEFFIESVIELHKIHDLWFIHPEDSLSQYNQ